jgi:signal transduction histidine kinase
VPVQHRQQTERRATYFDTPERTPQASVLRTAGSLARTSIVKDLLEVYPLPTVMLDMNRQIVAFNRRCRPFFARRDPATVYGLRFGEAIECVHAHEMDAGCGTSAFCRDCGAGVAIRTARHARRADSRECRITASRNGKPTALDLSMHASSIALNRRRLVLAVIQDISDEKRRQVFERIFFHDVLNTASAVRHGVQLLKSAREPDRLQELLGGLASSSSQLVDEIKAQRDLLNAERHELDVTREPASANWILSTIHDIYAASPLADGVRVALVELSPDAELRTDAVLAIRCLSNLVKNALEASARGGEVRLSGELRTSTVAFHVQNEGVLSDAVRRQMFQRSFSTKAERGRGIGTYSVRLLVEQYLGGAVSFDSDPERRTVVFTIELPRAAANVTPFAAPTDGVTS